MATAGVGRGRGRGRGLGRVGGIITSPGTIQQKNPALSNTAPSATTLQQQQQAPKQNDQQNVLQNKKKPDQIMFSPNRSVPPVHSTTNALNGQKHPSNSNGASVSNIGAISKLLENIETMKKSVVLSTLPSKIIEMCPDERGANEFTKIVCNKAINDAEFATVGAQLCNACWIMGFSALLRTPLLSTVQNEFKNKQKLKKGQYQGLTVFLCELYGILKVKGQTLKPLNKPVCELLKGLLEEKNLNEDSVFYFFQEMEKMGTIIEQDNKENMEELINRVRELCIYDEKLLPSSKCRLVQVLELRSASWKLTSEITNTYDDMSQDLMASGR